MQFSSYKTIFCDHVPTFITPSTQDSIYSSQGFCVDPASSGPNIANMRAYILTVLAAVETAYALGSAIVLNNSTSPLYLWSVGGVVGPQQKVVPGTFGAPLRTNDVCSAFPGLKSRIWMPKGFRGLELPYLVCNQTNNYRRTLHGTTLSR